MSVLSREEIIIRIKKGNIRFTPSLDRFQIQTHSIDLRLGFTFLVPKSWQMIDQGRVALNIDYLSGVDKKYFEVIELEPGQYFEVLPKEFIIVTALEKIKLANDIVGTLYPRSSVNRRGLSVDLSGVIDAGYEGNLIVPVRNNTASQIIRVYPGERFCQVVLQSLAQKVRPKKSRYQKKDIIVGILKERSGREVRLIKQGKIKELKSAFALNIKNLLPQTDSKPK